MCDAFLRPSEHKKLKVGTRRTRFAFKWQARRSNARQAETKEATTAAAAALL
jgi:hypothetical protein